MKVSLLTLGCKANQAESSLIDTTLRRRGWEVVGLDESPDFCVINTCSVTAKSEHQSRQLIKRANKTGAQVVVTGCYSELNPQEVKIMNGVSSVITNSKKHNIIEELTGIPVEGSLSYGECSRSRVFIKVQDGCDSACSYCLIPKARGRSRSVNPDYIIEQISDNADIYNEVVLTGIHLGTYGNDMCPKVKLSYLTRQILMKTKIKRIRLSSLEINEIDDELVDLLHDGRLCGHLHIPLQSGDNTVLKLMNRYYTADEYSLKINMIYNEISNIALGTDVIVGFPGETKKEFLNTYKLIESLPFSYLHVFSYSPRKGTEAYEMMPETAPTDKKTRALALRELGMAKKKIYIANQVGRTLDLIVEKRDTKDMITGITGNYLKVRALTDEVKPKELAAVRISGHAGETLLGYLIH